MSQSNEQKTNTSKTLEESKSQTEIEKAAKRRAEIEEGWAFIAKHGME